MAPPIPLRADFDAPAVCALARRSRDAAQTRRLLALAAIYGAGGISPSSLAFGSGLAVQQGTTRGVNCPWLRVPTTTDSRPSFVSP